MFSQRHIMFMMKSIFLRSLKKKWGQFDIKVEGQFWCLLKS